MPPLLTALCLSRGDALGGAEPFDELRCSDNLVRERGPVELVCCVHAIRAEGRRGIPDQCHAIAKFRREAAGPLDAGVRE